MALSEIEDQLAGVVPWRTCAVCHHMSERGEEWAATLRRLLSNRGLRFKGIAKALAQDPDEPDIPWEALSRHAQNGCQAHESLR